MRLGIWRSIPRPWAHVGAPTLVHAVSRWSSSTDSTPTETEVRQAYRVLGLPIDTASTAETLELAAVRKSFLNLAKTHHPDTNGASSAGNASKSTSKMMEINQAYKTIQDFFKSGGSARSLLQPSRSHGGTYDRSAFGREGYESYASPDMTASYWEGFAPPGAGPVYSPEDFQMSPDEFIAFHDAFGHMDQYPPFSAWEQEFQARPPPHYHHHQERPRGSRGGQWTTSESTREEQQPEFKSKLTEVEQQALANMYRDGKSFEFISNALGKPVSDIMAEFNAQSEQGQFAHRKSHKSTPKRQRRRPQHTNYVEFDDEEELFDFMGAQGPDGGVFFVDGVPVNPNEFFRREAQNSQRHHGSHSAREAEDDKRLRDEYAEFLNAQPYQGNVHQHSSFERNPKGDRHHQRQNHHHQQQQQHHQSKRGRGRGRGGAASGGNAFSRGRGSPRYQRD